MIASAGKGPTEGGGNQLESSPNEGWTKCFLRRSYLGSLKVSRHGNEIINIKNRIT